jgi:hypothetical protein
MEGCGVPREPKIAKMDWRALGYWPVYKDNRLVWEKDVEAFNNRTQD